MLFERIAEKLKTTVEAYAIGGTAMMFYAIKAETKDIDLVFLKEQDRQTFIEALKEMKYETYNSRLVYTKKENVPLMFSRGENERFDLFGTKIITLEFTQHMVKRAKNVNEYNKKLIIKSADPHDIIIMNCATDRAKDEEDIITIIKNTKINWDIIIQEIEEQVKKGNQTAMMDLGYLLERLREDKKAEIPLEVLNKLYNKVQKQIEQKQRKLQPK